MYICVHIYECMYWKKIRRIIGELSLMCTRPSALLFLCCFVASSSSSLSPLSLSLSTFSRVYCGITKRCWIQTNKKEKIYIHTYIHLYKKIVLVRCSKRPCWVTAPRLCSHPFDSRCIAIIARLVHYHLIIASCLVVALFLSFIFIHSLYSLMRVGIISAMDNNSIVYFSSYFYCHRRVVRHCRPLELLYIYMYIY